MDIGLDEFDKDEWFSDCLRIRPDITSDEFDELWDEFKQYQEWKLLH